MPWFKLLTMFLFETILFDNRIPSYYRVYFQEGRYYLEAIRLDYYKHVSFPDFFIRETEPGKWEAEGTNNPELIKQAVEDIRKFAPAQKTEALA